MSTSTTLLHTSINCVNKLEQEGKPIQPGWLYGRERQIPCDRRTQGTMQVIAILQSTSLEYSLIVS